MRVLRLQRRANWAVEQGRGGVDCYLRHHILRLFCLLVQLGRAEHYILRLLWRISTSGCAFPMMFLMLPEMVVAVFVR